ncbi:phosphoribosylaminoimidazolesuccinocarboxamide synthase [Acidimicrobiia bacterium]|nr:phosphoribosylaminoimidazolesuccinocarboxamide synthase [Acidimicrobiia bacterium]
MRLNLPHVHSGKVRDIYEIDSQNLLMVTSDRLSAFDVVLNEPIPEKGRVLTAMTRYWLEKLNNLVPNHLISVDPTYLSDEISLENREFLLGRTMICRRAEMLPVECIVRGFITGSAWKEYKENGTVHGEKVVSGLKESEQFQQPLFTPSTKATSGHDENISFSESIEILGSDLAEKVKDTSLKCYKLAADLAMERGIIIADTKFEFGLIDGELVLADEVLTPDSSRFWPEEQWSIGSSPPSFDKQPVRDFLDGTEWDKKPPPPTLPSEVISATSSRYIEAYEKISGKSFEDWPGGRS